MEKPWIDKKTLQYITEEVMLMTHNDNMNIHHVISFLESLNPPAPAITDVKCPECEGEMISRKGQYGTFWGCKKYPNCKGTRDSEGLSREERAAARAKNAPEVTHEAGFPFRRS